MLHSFVPGNMKTHTLMHAHTVKYTEWKMNKGGTKYRRTKGVLLDLRLEALLAVLIWFGDKSTCRLIVFFLLHWPEWTGAFLAGAEWAVPSVSEHMPASRARLCHAVPQLWQVSKSQQVCGSIPWDSFNGDTWWGLWIREEMKDHPLSKRHFHWSHTG